MSARLASSRPSVAIFCHLRIPQISTTFVIYDRGSDSSLRPQFACINGGDGAESHHEFTYQDARCFPFPAQTGCLRSVAGIGAGSMFQAKYGTARRYRRSRLPRRTTATSILVDGIAWSHYSVPDRRYSPTDRRHHPEASV